jgi:hypothetical protein
MIANRHATDKTPEFFSVKFVASEFFSLGKQ